MDDQRFALNSLKRQFAGHASSWFSQAKLEDSRYHIALALFNGPRMSDHDERIRASGILSSWSALREGVSRMAKPYLDVIDRIYRTIYFT